MAESNTVDFYEQVRDVLIEAQPGEILAIKPAASDAEAQDTTGAAASGLPYGPAKLGIYAGNGYILHQRNGKLCEDPFWIFTNLTFLRPPSHVLDSMHGVQQLFRKEPEEVLAVAREHISMPAKEYRHMFHNFMAFAAWCHYYPDVRRHPPHLQEPYRCARTGWREIELVAKHFDEGYLKEIVDPKHRDRLFGVALWQVPDVIVGCMVCKAATESFFPNVKTFLLGFAAIKMIGMNINNILRDTANNKHNLCETFFEYLFWLSEKNISWASKDDIKWPPFLPKSEY